MTKIAQLFITFFFVVFILQQCCDKVEKHYYTINKISPKVVSEEDSTQVACTVEDSMSADTLLISLNPQLKYVASKKVNRNWGLIPSAKAYQCPKKGDQGMKHPLIAIKVSLQSDTSYNLTNKVILYSSTPGFGNSVSQWLNARSIRFPRCVEIPKFRPSDSIFQAHFKFTYEDGTSVEGQTDTFVWKME